MGIQRLRVYLERLVDWTAVKRLNLHKIVIIFIIIDFVVSMLYLPYAVMNHFLHVHYGGRDGFFKKSFSRLIRGHVDIYKFRRFQRWEFEDPIDWSIGERKYINITRERLDKLCSHYRGSAANPGDPGDYLKEVAGKPNSSGWNQTLNQLSLLLVAIVTLVLFSTPTLLLATWWRSQRIRIICFYVMVQLVPMFLVIDMGVQINSKLMCAMRIIYEPHKVILNFNIVAVIFWLYQIVKIFCLLLYCVEKTLTDRRADIGFERRIEIQHRHARKMEHVGEEDLHEEDSDEEEEDELEFDDNEPEVKTLGNSKKETGAVAAQKKTMPKSSAMEKSVTIPIVETFLEKSMKKRFIGLGTALQRQQRIARRKSKVEPKNVAK